jgi:hypothetical protein
MHCARRYFTGYGELARSNAIPPISEAMAEALDAVHFTASSVGLRQEFRVGDVQFVNNLAVLHAREGYVDGPGRRCVSLSSPAFSTGASWLTLVANRRHLIRLWLRDPERAWETPEGVRERWARVYDDVRPERAVFPLEPVVRSEGRKGAKNAEGAGTKI